MTPWRRVVHASVVHTGTEQMLTLCGRPAAYDVDPADAGPRRVICSPPKTGAASPGLARPAISF